MEKILSKLKNLSGVLGVYLLDVEGNLLYVNSSLDNPPIELSYTLASLKGYLNDLLDSTKMGKFADCFINGSVGRIIFNSLKNGDLLVIFASNVSNLGMIKFEMSNAIQQIENIR
ncbi:MAG: roadblock/LC7 domain-containing protein [Caldisericum exile]|uniref:roadblock/LC7 domain-containing protein n=1 Tax=Caldisericum exile TaxID=693075 RepID=UPI003C734338